MGRFDIIIKAPARNDRKVQGELVIIAARGTRQVGRCSFVFTRLLLQLLPQLHRYGEATDGEAYFTTRDLPVVIWFLKNLLFLGATECVTISKYHELKLEITIFNDTRYYFEVFFFFG